MIKNGFSRHVYNREILFFFILLILRSIKICQGLQASSTLRLHHFRRALLFQYKLLTPQPQILHQK